MTTIEHSLMTTLARYQLRVRRQPTTMRAAMGQVIELNALVAKLESLLSEYAHEEPDDTERMRRFVGREVASASRDQIQTRNYYDWPDFCSESDGGCDVALTEVDQMAGYCTNCRKPITESESEQ